MDICLLSQESASYENASLHGIRQIKVCLCLPESYEESELRDI